MQRGGVGLTSPGQTYSVSLFLEHFIEDLRINRSLVSTLYTVGTLVGGFARIGDFKVMALGKQLEPELIGFSLRDYRNRL